MARSNAASTDQQAERTKVFDAESEIVELKKRIAKLERQADAHRMIRGDD